MHTIVNWSFLRSDFGWLINYFISVFIILTITEPLKAQSDKLHDFCIYGFWSEMLDTSLITVPQKFTLKREGKRYVVLDKLLNTEKNELSYFKTSGRVMIDSVKNYYYNIYHFTEVVNDWDTWVRLDVVGTYSAIIVSENDEELSLYQEVYSGLSLIGDIIAEEAKNSTKRRSWKNENGELYQILLLDPFYNPKRKPEKKGPKPKVMTYNDLERLLIKLGRNKMKKPEEYSIEEVVDVLQELNRLEGTSIVEHSF